MTGTSEGSGAGSGAAPLSFGGGFWRVRGGQVDLTGPVVMGIVNLTPDSFSDGGRFRHADEALRAAEAMVVDGAALIDVGGESTRPGAAPVSPAEEEERVLAFVEAAARELPVPISIDTRRASVARAALDAGAAVVNDVSGFHSDAEMARTVAANEAGVVLMHMRGEPATMAGHATYGDVGVDVADELRSSIAEARAAGVRDEAIVLDPGIGFAKTADQSLALLADLAPLRALGFPLPRGPEPQEFPRGGPGRAGRPAPLRHHRRLRRGLS